jgi:hypothetical protein
MHGSSGRKAKGTSAGRLCTASTTMVVVTTLHRLFSTGEKMKARLTNDISFPILLALAVL